MKSGNAVKIYIFQLVVIGLSVLHIRINKLI